MRLRRLIPYFTQGIAVGIIFGLAVVLFLWLKPFESSPVIKINEVKSQRNNPSQEQKNRNPFSYADAVSTAAPSVVNIHTTKIIKQRIHPLFDDPRLKRFFGDRIAPPRERRQNSLGSGVIVSPQGYILTNNHVIDGADEILVALNDGRTARAEVIGTDPETDLAVLHITLDQLQGITMGNSEELRVGDVVLAIGNPFGVGQTVTQGIVSATGRKQLGLSTFENFIQTDAAINPGNSGGALVNPYGELVGINTAIFSRSGGSEGIGFAIPTDLAKNVLTQLIEQGRVVRSWLGIETQSITPALAESFGLADDIKGILVAGVMRNSPGATAGLKPGDIITHIDKKEINLSSDAMKLILEAPPGTTINLQLLRNAEIINLKATLGNRPTPLSPKS